MTAKNEGDQIIDFSESFHPEFYGYLGIEDNGVWISFIVSREKGRGNFSKLLSELKEKYEWIKIPTPSNHMIEIALKHGFVWMEEWFPEPYNEMGEIMYWKKVN